MAVPAFLSRLAAGSGLTTIARSSRDTKLLCMQRFVRLFAYGMSFLILVHFLSNLDINDERIGLFMTMTLLGDTVISFILTLITDKVGRKKVLVAGSLLMTMSGLVFCVSSNYWILVLASVVGVISPSGNEIGPFRAIEESILAQLTEKDDRSDIFAWYTLFGTAGTALGALTCGLLVQLLESVLHWDITWAYRLVFFLYGLFGLIKALFTIMLSRAVEVEPVRPSAEEDIELEVEGLLSSSSSSDNDDDNKTETTPKTSPPKKPRASSNSSNTHTPPLRSTVQRLQALLPSVSRQSRAITLRLTLLFALDSFASGLASPSWLTYFFTTAHGLPAATLGALFLTTNILAAGSNLVALPIARRLGPLKTMTFTHLPSAIFLALVPLPPADGGLGTGLAAGLLALRACTQSMDQAPRQAFIAAVVLPTERTAIFGVVNVVKTVAQAGGIGSAGVLAGAGLWVLMLSGAGGLKAGYDLMILWAFLGVKDRDGGESNGMA